MTRQSYRKINTVLFFLFALLLGQILPLQLDCLVIFLSLSSAYASWRDLRAIPEMAIAELKDEHNRQEYRAITAMIGAFSLIMAFFFLIGAATFFILVSDLF